MAPDEEPVPDESEVPRVHVIEPASSGRPVRLGLGAKLMGFRDRESTRRQVLNRRLIRYREDLSELGFLSRDDDRELWRLSVRVNVLNDMEYDEVLEVISDRVDSVLGPKGLGPEAIRPVYTGLIPLAHVGQQELANGLLKSFGLALLLIAAVMVVLLRGVTAGLLAMLPNVFPAAS